MSDHKYIDAVALINSLLVDPVECPGCPEPEYLPELIAILAEAPEVESAALKGVLCTECLFYLPGTAAGWCVRYDQHMESRDFCSRGKRKADRDGGD